MATLTAEQRADVVRDFMRLLSRNRNSIPFTKRELFDSFAAIDAALTNQIVGMTGNIGGVDFSGVSNVVKARIIHGIINKFLEVM